MEGKKKPGDVFVARLDEAGVCVNVDPAEVYVERLRPQDEMSGRQAELLQSLDVVRGSGE